jgi:predicted transcriptional regulator
MATSKSRRPEKALTQVELELMTILWQLGGGTVNDVLAALPRQRPLAYTSVSTILRILEQKGVLAAAKVGRGHRYVPLVARDAYQTFALAQVVGTVFGGEPVALVRRLVDAAELSPKDLQALRVLLEEKKNEKDSKKDEKRDEKRDERKDAKKEAGR